MGSGPEGVSPRYHIQKVGDQYEVRSVGKLRSWAVRVFRGEYAASKGSLGRLLELAKKLDVEKPKDQARLRGLVRSLAGMLETCPPGQRELVQDTLKAVGDLLGPQKEGELKNPGIPQTSQEKLAIAKSIIERARAGKQASHWPQAFLEGDPSPLSMCFEEYLSQPGLTKEGLAQIIEAMYVNGEDYGEALQQALKSKSKEEAPAELKKTIKEAILLFAAKVLRPCMDALEDPQSKDFGVLMLRARQGIELVLAVDIPLESLVQTIPFLTSFFEQMFTKGLEFSTTAALTSRRFIRSAPTNEEAAQQWAASSPSMPLRDTFDRMTAIELGGMPRKTAVRPEGAPLANTYYYNQALKEYLEKQGVSNAGEVANQLMLRCTIESTSDIFLKTFGNVLLRSSKKPESVQFNDNVSGFGLHPVIEPGRPTVRFSVEKDTGKCIIERVCPMQFGSRYAWRVSRAEFDPKKIGDQWTETVTTKPYAEALADEVYRRVVEEGKTQDEAIAEVADALKLQITDEPKRLKLLEQMRLALAKGSAPGSESQTLPQTPQEKLAIAKSIIARARSGKQEAHWPQAFLEGDPSPLCMCFEEYLSKTKLSKEELARIIEAMQENAGDCWVPLLQALQRMMRKEGTEGQKARSNIQAAARLVATKVLPPCVKALRTPNARDLGRTLQAAQRVVELARYTQTEVPYLGEVTTLLQGFVHHAILPGLTFSMTVSHPSRGALASTTSRIPKFKEWAEKAPSVPIRDAFGQRDAIEIGGEWQGIYAIAPEDQKDIQLVNAYYYNQALKKYLESRGIANAQEVANELMLRCAEGSTATSVLASVAGDSPDHGQIREATELEEHPVIQPDRPTIRFSVEDGKCIIERSFPITYEFPDRPGHRQFAWCVSRVEVDPSHMGDQWTETVTTKPYAQALGEEVRRRTSQRDSDGQTSQEREAIARSRAIKEVEDAVWEQMGDAPEAADLVAHIREEA
jgi:hypothetical protein